MSDFSDSRAMASAERAYLEPPGGDIPRDAEDWLDAVIVWPEQDEDADRFTGWVILGEVTDYEEWEDADEDGRYGGVNLEVTRLERDGTRATEKRTMSPGDLEDAERPKDGPVAAALEKAVEFKDEAEKLEARAKALRNRLSNQLGHAMRETLKTKAEEES